MLKFTKDHWLFILLFLSLSILYFSGVKDIPFHPDEATYIYMSSDVNILFTDPTNLYFDSNKIDDQKQRYRLIDAPLSRYSIGISRSIAKIPPLASDWDWGESWEVNLENGAFPDKNLLLAGRIALTAVLLISTIFIYISGSHVGGRISGFLAAFLLGFNALALLHGRRAMAEGIVIFGISLFLFSMLYSRKFPWLTGLAVAIAVNAKHSTFPLLIIGLLAVCWFSKGVTKLKLRIIQNITLYMGSFILITLALNPVFWNQPLLALNTALSARQNLMSQQVADTQLMMPERILDSYGKKTAAFLANLFILPPSVAEVGNYLENTAESEQAYFSKPWNNLFRGFTGGGLILMLVILGMTLSGYQVRSQSIESARIIILFLLTTFLQTIGLFIFISLPWQRYVIPLVPLISLWAGLGLGYTLNTFIKRINENRGNSNVAPMM